ncbi:glycosyltransferase family 9 protein [Omnitrophica bacterium]|nr:glycosyltransferase family 9 protein [Candidatus Omnitrophota bacterium]
MRRSKESIFKDREDPLKILLINPFGIGDVLFSTPLIEILKEDLPASSLYYICNKRTHQVIEKCPALEKIFIFEKGDYKELWKKDKPLFFKELISFINKIKDERFDLAIDMSMGHQYGFFLKLIRVPERIGFDYKGRGRFHTKRLRFDGFDDRPIGEYYKDLLRLADLKVAERTPTKIWRTKDDEDYIDGFLKRERLAGGDILIGIAPGGGVSFGTEKIAFKRWPLGKFAELADGLMKDMGAKVIFIWGPGERDLVERIADLMSERPVISPETTIRQMAVLMSRCDCVVCNDSGPLHVAVASGAPTVSIFGPSDQRVYGPYPEDSRHITVTRDIDCRPCYKKFKVPDCTGLDCLNGLDSREVFRAVTGHIREQSLNVNA